MSQADFISLLPLLVLAGTVLLLMIVVAIRRSHRVAASITFAGLIATLVSLWPASGAIPRRVTPLLLVDSFALLFIGLLATATAVVVVLAYNYLEHRDEHKEEFYLLVLIAAFGSCVLVCSSHFASLFLGLEILSISLFGLVPYPHTSKLPLEAGIKYLVLAASSVAFLLFGMALVYGETGTLSLADLAQRAAEHPSITVAAGIALMVVGIGFKLAVVPFHMWTPDVYEGTPAPVTAFIATVSKGGMLGLVLRYFGPQNVSISDRIFLGLAIIAVASMIGGNLLALLQNNVKRMLAYSSIAHMGYMFVGLLAGGELGAAAATYYLSAYFVTILIAFGVITVLSGEEREAELMEDYRGLFWRRPAITALFTATLLSLAGIPLTAGFMGKFAVVAAGSSAAKWGLVMALVLTSALGLFYYLRLVVMLYAPPKEGAEQPAERITLGGRAALAVLALLLVVLGVYPGPLWNLIRSGVAGLV